MLAIVPKTPVYRESCAHNIFKTTTAMNSHIKSVADKLKKFSAEEVDCVALSLKILGSLGFWSEQTSDQKPLAKRWYPRILGLIMAWMTFVISPISIYQFWGQKLNILMGSIISMFLTCLGLVQVVSLLCLADRFHKMVDALHSMKSFHHVIELPKSDAHTFKTISQLILCNLVVLYLTVIFLSITAIPYYFYIMDTPFNYWFTCNFQLSPCFEINFANVAISITFIFVLVGSVSSLFMACLLEAFRQLRLLNCNISYVFLSPNGRLLRDFRSQLMLAIDSKSTQKYSKTCNVNSWLEDIQVDEEKSSTNSVESLETLKRKHKSPVTYLRVNQEAGTRLRQCITHHEAIIRFVKALESAFEPYVAMEYICTLFPATLIIVYVTHDPVFDIKLLMYLVMLAGVMTHIAAFSWLAQKLTDENETMRDAVYGCDWYEATGSLKRSLRIMMSFSNQPLVVRIAGFVPLNMETYFQTMRLTYSYFMFITTTMNKPTIRYKL